MQTLNNSRETRGLEIAKSKESQVSARASNSDKEMQGGIESV